VISETPRGVGELALSGHLSVQVIEMLSGLPQALSSVYTSREGAPVRSLVNQFLVLPLSKTERQLCHGTIAACLRTKDKLEALSVSADQLFRIASIALEENGNYRGMERDCAIWASFAIAGVLHHCGRSHIARGLLNRILATFHEAKRWPRLEEIFKQFFWNPLSLHDWRDLWESATVRFGPSLRTGSAPLSP